MFFLFFSNVLSVPCILLVVTLFLLCEHGAFQPHSLALSGFEWGQSWGGGSDVPPVAAARVRRATVVADGLPQSLVP